jgi:hypothetical protein
MENSNGKDSFYRDTIEEMGSENYPLEDPMTFWNEEKKTLWKKIMGRTETPFVLMGIGLVLIIVVFFAVYPGREGQESGPAVEGLSDRFQQVEENVASLASRVDGLIQVQQDMERLKKSVLRFDSADASATLRLDRMAKDLAALKKEVEEIKNKAAFATKPGTSSAQAENTKTVSRTVIYEVQKGDTLYNIGRRFGMSVEAIRKLNGLSTRDAIYPGQRLKVKG